MHRPALQQPSQVAGPHASPAGGRGASATPRAHPVAAKCSFQDQSLPLWVPPAEIVRSRSLIHVQRACRPSRSSAEYR